MYPVFLTHFNVYVNKIRGYSFLKVWYFFFLSNKNLFFVVKIRKIFFNEYILINQDKTVVHYFHGLFNTNTMFHTTKVVVLRTPVVEIFMST